MRNPLSTPSRHFRSRRNTVVRVSYLHVPLEHSNYKKTTPPPHPFLSPRQNRIKTGQWLVVVGGILFFTASGSTGGKLPSVAMLDSFLATAPLLSASSPSSSPQSTTYKPGDDLIESAGVASLDGEEGEKAAAAAALAVQRAIVGDFHGRLTELRAAAEAWGIEARALQAGGGKGSPEAMEALLSRDVLRVVKVGSGEEKRRGDERRGG